MSSLLQDLRYGLRMLAKSPGFTAVAVLTLSLGIGANTAIFSVIDAVLFRPLPYPQPEQLAKVWMRFTGIGQPKDQNWVSAPEFRDLRELNRSFSGIAAMGEATFNIGVKGTPERIEGVAVSPTLFSILGVQARVGRTFLEEEAQPGRNRVLLLAYGLWQRGFGGDPGVVGRTLTVNGQPNVVVGVLPEGFEYPGQVEMWAPLAFTADDLSPGNRGNHGLEVLARIKPGVSLAQARADMDVVTKKIIEQNPDYPYRDFNFAVLLNPLLDEVVGDVKTSLWVLMAAVGFVLLIGCGNVANLLLVRASAREKETAIRVALGAGPGRLLRQYLTESVVLSLAGGLAGLILAPWALKWLVMLGATALPRVVSTTLDRRALAFTAIVSVGTGILFGLAPALQATRRMRYDILKEGGRGGAAAASHVLRHLLVAGEVALSLVLLAGAGLLLESFIRVLKVDPGFRPEGVLTMQVSLPQEKYAKREQVRAFFRNALDRVQALPGVEAAGAVDVLPLSGANSSGTVTVDSHAVPRDQTTPEADQRAVMSGYFKALGIPLIAGRYFDEHDTDVSPPVAIIDETMARTYWPNDDPIGKRIKLGGRPSTRSWMTVVGVVRHVRYRTLEAPSRVELYWPEAQNPSSSMRLAIRTSQDPMRLAANVRRQIAALDPDQPVYRIRTMEELMSDSLARRRLAMIFLGVFAGMASLLAAIGIYGVTAYSVSQRHQEIGIRMALGAGRGDVLRLVVGQGFMLAISGLAVGLVATLALTRLMASLLYGVRAADPATLVVVSALLAAVALVATYVPARHAAKVDPMLALRYE